MLFLLIYMMYRFIFVANGVENEKEFRLILILI